jgi:stearoyl-CoA desaturase (Delta-9 desaturase)
VTYALVGLGVALLALKLLDRRIPHALYRALLAGFIVLPLAAAAYAIWSLWDQWIGWRELSLFLGLYVLTGLGTTLGYHRLVAHGSFETRGAVKFVLLVLGAMNVQGRVVDWAAVHRKHHAHADREGDPHSPLEGFLHAHVGWILRIGEVDRERYCKGLLRDRIVLFVDRTTAVWAALGLVFPLAVAGWKGLLWGGLVRIAFTNHVTFAVNSICHLYGRRAFPTRDESRNNWLIGTLALGEGWHNNHHAFPAMAYHGIGRWQLDLSGLVLRLLVRLRLAWNVKLPAPAALDRAREAA